MAYSYNVNPMPNNGLGIFGEVPGQLSTPNPYGDLSNVYPNLSGTNSAVANNIFSQLSGNLSPSTQMQLQNYAASFGAGQGQNPGSNADLGTFSNLYGAEELGKTSEALQQQGISNYNATIPTVSGTQTVSPALQTEIANLNAINAAAPDPTQAGNYAHQLFDQYLNAMQNSGNTMANIGMGIGDIGSLMKIYQGGLGSAFGGGGSGTAAAGAGGYSDLAGGAFGAGATGASELDAELALSALA